MIKNKKIVKCLLISIVWVMLLIPFFNFVTPAGAQVQPTLSLSPAQVSVTNPDNTFVVAFKISGVTNLWGWTANVTYDSQYLVMTNDPVQGDFLSNAGCDTIYLIGKDGVAEVQVDKIDEPPRGVSGDGTLMTLTFRVLKPFVSTTITVYATNLLSNQYTTGTLWENLPIDPYPVQPYATATVSYVPSSGVPVADPGQNQTVNQFTNVVLDASNTIPQDAADQTYTWTFFDNESRTLTGKTVNYNFVWPGTFPVTLTVTNSKGTSTALIDITVNSITPPVPIMTIEGYTEGQNFPVNQAIVFNSDQSYDPYNLTLTSMWDFGNGQSGLGTQRIPIKYVTAGTYTVSLTVTNSAGINATATKTIVVGDGAGANPNDIATDSASTDSASTATGSPPSGANSTPPLATQSFSLSTIILYPLIFATVFALGGAAFWLRKK